MRDNDHLADNLQPVITVNSKVSMRGFTFCLGFCQGYH